MSREVDCLIIGAGSSGLTLGIGLRKIGKSVLIVDKVEIQQEVSKAIVVDKATLQALEHYGVPDRLSELSSALDGITFNIAGDTMLSFAFDLTDEVSSQHPFTLPLKGTEDCLVQRFTQLGGQIIKGAVFEPDVNHISKYAPNEPMDIVLNYDGVRFPVRCDWLFGCDGLHSAVRNALMIEFNGTTEHEDRYVIDAAVKHWPYPTQVNYWFGLSETRYAMLLLHEPLTVRVMASTRAACELLLQGCEVTDVLYSGRFSHAYRVAHRFGRDRIWLVGDAAAVFSPVGSRGHNWGMLDALSLVHAIHHNNTHNYAKHARNRAWAYAVVDYAVSQVLMSRRWYCKLLRLVLLVVVMCVRRVLGEKWFGWLVWKVTSFRLLNDTQATTV